MSGIPEHALPDLIQLARLTEQSDAAWADTWATFPEGEGRRVLLELEAAMSELAGCRRAALHQLLRNSVPTKAALRLVFGPE